MDGDGDGGKTARHNLPMMPCFGAHLADVDAGLILVVGPVAHSQAQLVLDVGPVQIHLLQRENQDLVSA